MSQTKADDAAARGEGDAPRRRRFEELPPAAQRALWEAEERRAREAPDPAAGGGQRPAEIDGRPGPEPVRYGDWEKNGIACDF